MNVRYRVELSQTERAELTALLSTTAKANRAKNGPRLGSPNRSRRQIALGQRGHNHCAEVLVAR